MFWGEYAFTRFGKVWTGRLLDSRDGSRDRFVGVVGGIRFGKLGVYIYIYICM